MQVNESNKNAQCKLNISDVNQILILSKLGESQILTSKKIKDEIIKFVKIKDDASKLVPKRPNQRPPKPHIIVLNKGNKIITKYIFKLF